MDNKDQPMAAEKEREKEINALLSQMRCEIEELDNVIHRFIEGTKPFRSLTPPSSEAGDSRPSRLSEIGEELQKYLDHITKLINITNEAIQTLEV